MDVFLLLTLPRIWAKIQTSIMHTSVVRDEFVVIITSYSGLCFHKLRFPVHSLVCFEVDPQSTLAKACLWCSKRQNSPHKARGQTFAISHSVNKLLIYSLQKQASMCWHKPAGCFQMLDLVSIWKPLGCEPPEWMKYFVTKPRSPVIEMEEKALGYSLLTYPMHYGGYARMILSP